MARPKLRSSIDYARWFASRGGKARSRALTAAQRSASAKKAANSRWRGASREERREVGKKLAQARAKAKKRS